MDAKHDDVAARCSARRYEKSRQINYRYCYYCVGDFYDTLYFVETNEGRTRRQHGPR